MGWCSGTKLFDGICKVLFEPENTDFNEILKQIINEFEDMDWDCQQDSQYWDTPAVRKAFQELHPEWFDGSED